MSAGRYLAMGQPTPELFLCTECGAAVRNTILHDEFHSPAQPQEDT